MIGKPKKPELNIPLVAGNYYWVRTDYNKEFEPAKCDFRHGDYLYFYFTNGSVMEVERVWEVEPLKHE